MDLISDIDLVKLEEELKSEKLNFNDVANYISGLNIDENNLEDYQQSLKLIKISQILLKFATNKVKSTDEHDKYVFQCNNCSKAFRKSEYLDNHIQRRHVNTSLAENGLLPLIEQIKRYNSGLFVESKSIDDLKEEIKNLHVCLKETSEDLIKEKTAREKLQSIIESEIIETLNSIQENWAINLSSKGHLEKIDEMDEKQTDTNIDENLNDEINKQMNKQMNKEQSLERKEHLKDSSDFNLFLIKQNELIEKLGKNIDRFVEHNDETKTNDKLSDNLNDKLNDNLNDKQLQNFISSVIHKEIENLFSNKDSKSSKDSKLKKISNRRFLLSTNNKKELPKEVETKRLSLHEFSAQNDLNQHQTDHTDEIVHEINQIINEEILIKNSKNSSSFTSKFSKRFPFRFRKSKSLIQLNGTTESSKDDDEKNKNKNNSSAERIDKSELLNDENRMNENSTDKINDEKINNTTNKISDKSVSRFGFKQFVSKKKDNEQDKISLNKFSSRQMNKINQTQLDESSDQNELAKDENDKRSIGINQNVKQLINKNESKVTLKSVLKKSNSTDSNLKLPKKQIAFSDERIEFSAEEIDSYSSDTESNYSLGNQNTTNSFILTPTEQVVTVQKVIEKPIPTPRRVNQQNTLTSL